MRKLAFVHMPRQNVQINFGPSLFASWKVHVHSPFKSENSSFQPSSMIDLFGNHKDMVYCDVAQICGATVKIHN